MSYNVEAALQRMRTDVRHPWAGRLLAAVQHAEQRAERLTRAELRVVSAMSHGLNREMTADTLGISVETVKEHTKNARRKIGAKNTTHLCCIALREGWVK